MKRVVISTLVLTIAALVGYAVYEERKQEQMYRVQVQQWSSRLAEYTQIIIHDKYDVVARLALLDLQKELQDVLPPARYKEAHDHLVKAIMYYNAALDTTTNEESLRLLALFDKEIKAAESTYK